MACANSTSAMAYDSRQRPVTAAAPCASTVTCRTKGLAKWISKADNGYRHSKAFTLQDFPEPIVMTDGNRLILQNNCLDMRT